MPTENRTLAFQNKVAVITGASSGIGRATALALAAGGACLGLGARNLPALEQLASQIEELGCQALAVKADVTHSAQVEILIQKTIERWGRVDILVANAGQYIRAPISRMKVADLERSMAVNFYGSVYPVLKVLPHMIQRRSGHIVFVNSMNARKGIPPDAPYVSAKSALSGFSEVLRQELYGSGVYVSAIYPGRVDTPMIAHLRVPWLSAKISPEAVAKAIVRAIQRKQEEVILPPQAKMLHLLNVFSPRLADWVVRSFHLEGWEER